jgi:hypothetical protein
MCIISLNSIYYKMNEALLALKMIPDLFFVSPLRILYFRGPRIWGWGGWEGISFEDICAQLTLVPASVWKDQITNCTELLERKFSTFLVSVFGAAYFFTLYKVISYIYFRYFVLAPLITELKKCLISDSRKEREKIA